MRMRGLSTGIATPCWRHFIGANSMSDRKWTLEELKAHLDRKPPPFEPESGYTSSGFRRLRPWRAWFDLDGEYLGNRSGAVHKEDGDE